MYQHVFCYNSNMQANTNIACIAEVNYNNTTTTRHITIFSLKSPKKYLQTQYAGTGESGAELF